MRCGWPMKSERVCGRRRSARGADSGIVNVEGSLEVEDLSRFGVVCGF